MKWLVVFKEKTKIVFLLPVMVVLILTLIVASKNQISQVDKSVHSIYHDRLVAGRAITQIMDLHYQNHFLIEKYIHADTLPLYAQLEDQVAYNYRQMDSIMHEFRKTVLVGEEKEALQAYEIKNKAHRIYQHKMFELNKQAANASLLLRYSREEETSFGAVLGILRNLSVLQPQVGKTLLQDSQQSIRLIQELSFLEIAFVIILFAIVEMIIFVMLVKVGHKLHPQNQKFWLN